MPCRYCRLVAHCETHDVWLHQAPNLFAQRDRNAWNATREVDVDVFLADGNSEATGSLLETTSTLSLAEVNAHGLNDDAHLKIRKVSRKPLMGVWFSRGRWLYDPYNDNGHQCSDETNDDLADEKLVYVLPHAGTFERLLHLRTADDFRRFTKKYGASQPRSLLKTRIRHFLQQYTDNTRLQRTVEALRHAEAQENEKRYVIDLLSSERDQVQALFQRIIKDGFYQYTLLHLCDDLKAYGRTLCLRARPDVPQDVLGDDPYVRHAAAIDEHRQQHPASVVSLLVNAHALKYGRAVLEENGTETIYDVIDWSRVYREYDGIALHARSCQELDVSHHDPWFRWFLGYDVKSLIIWNRQALENRFYRLKLTL